MATSNPITVLQHHGYRTDWGWLSTTRRFMDDTKGQWTKRNYESFITELLSEELTFDSDEQAYYITTYFVQELMRAHSAAPDVILNVEGIFILANELAGKYINRMDHGDLKFMRARPESDESFDETAPVTVDDRGNRKRKKGAKKQMAAELYQAERKNLTRGQMIARFMDEIGMSKAGATTYFHNNKVEFGLCLVN